MKSTKFLCIAILIIAVFFSGCGGGGKPDDLSDESYKLVEDMIWIGNMYLNGNYDSKLAAESVYYKIEDFRDVEEPVSPSNTRVTLLFQTDALYQGLKANNPDSVKGNIELLEKTIGK